MNPNQIIPVPALFYDDHAERELPTPEQFGTREHKHRRWIRLHDPATPELLNDAEYYAEDVDGAPPNLIASARRTVAAIRKAYATFGVMA